MSTTPTAIAATEDNLHQRVKGFLGAGFFLLLRRFPSLLRLHRNEQSWTLFRIALAVFGAALVVLPLGLWKGWITAIFGLVLFVTAILLPPPDTESATDRKARELGAHTVVSGGEYRVGNAAATPVRLFISPAHVWALDKHFDPVVVILTAEIFRITVKSSEDRWLLGIRSAEHRTEFCFEGFFAERFARLAEESIRSAVPALAGENVKRLAAGASAR
jgi:hypothetical protein